MGNIQSIGEYAFFECKSIKTIHYKSSTVPECGVEVFNLTTLSTIDVYTNYTSDTFCNLKVNKNIEPPTDNSNQSTSSKTTVIVVSVVIVALILIIVGLVVFIVIIIKYKKAGKDFFVELKNDGEVDDAFNLVTDL